MKITQYNNSIINEGNIELLKDILYNRIKDFKSVITIKNHIASSLEEVADKSKAVNEVYEFVKDRTQFQIIEGFAALRNESLHLISKGILSNSQSSKETSALLNLPGDLRLLIFSFLTCSNIPGQGPAQGANLNLSLAKLHQHPQSYVEQVQQRRSACSRIVEKCSIM